MESKPLCPQDAMFYDWKKKKKSSTLSYYDQHFTSCFACAIDWCSPRSHAFQRLNHNMAHFTSSSNQLFVTIISCLMSCNELCCYISLLWPLSSGNCRNCSFFFFLLHSRLYFVIIVGIVRLQNFVLQKAFADHIQTSLINIKPNIYRSTNFCIIPRQKKKKKNFCIIHSYGGIRSQDFRGHVRIF